MRGNGLTRRWSCFQKRLPKNAMPYMSDIEKFADKLSQLTGYEIKGKYKPSGAILLA